MDTLAAIARQQAVMDTIADLIVAAGAGRTLSAALPHVVDDPRLVTANAVFGTLGSIAYTLGLGTAVALLQTGPPRTTATRPWPHRPDASPRRCLPAGRSPSTRSDPTRLPATA